MNKVSSHLGDARHPEAVEYQVSQHLKLDALNLACAQRKPPGVIRHSDRGSQYTSLAFGHCCEEMGVRPSRGSVGDAYDNAMAESFFATLECELLARRRFRTQAERADYVCAGLQVLPANRPFDRLSDVRYVAGMTLEIYRLVWPHLTRLGTGQVNLNAASRPVLLRRAIQPVSRERASPSGQAPYASAAFALHRSVATRPHLGQRATDRSGGLHREAEGQLPQVGGRSARWRDYNMLLT